MVISPDGASEATALRQMQLLSDPLGVDFKPYLLQVLARVRRNWMAIVPDSARMGRRGLVLIQFSIDRSGGVPKLVIASTSGITAFDRAAVAGISASNPFPPLPAAYKGDQIRLQMAFSYNLPPAKALNEPEVCSHAGGLSRDWRFWPFSLWTARFCWPPGYF